VLMNRVTIGTKKGNTGQSSVSGYFERGSDFLGRPTLRGPAGRPSWASIATRNRFEP
jgi:hypothetical protein